VHGNPRHHRHPRAYFPALITKVGIDPVFFGIFWVITNEVALLSPPLGVNLFIAQNLSGISFERVAKGAFPYMMLIICHHNADPVAGSALVASAPDGAILV
ncbi:MAG: TRAP transporter large permease subunit, partial [Bilophila wadsworthia]|uniref:TRAP transporter large permease subunit n=1 Tax=Bilophila wadsworthia TaxID=35833 RepID=UPI00300ED187